MGTLASGSVRPSHRVRILHILLLCVALALAACGGDGTGADPSPTDPGDATDAPTDAPTTPAAEVTFEGETLRIMVGYGTGGLYDTVARHIANHLPKHLPGEPTTVVENMPGGGGMIALNELYNNEPQDGTVLAVVDPFLAVQQGLGAEGIQFDAAEVQWIGAFQRAANQLVVRSDVDAEAALAGDQRLVVGTTGPGTASYITAVAFNRVLDLDLQIVSGYAQVADIFLAAESGEVDGFIISIGNNVVDGMLETGDFKPLVVTGADVPDRPDLVDVPLAEDLTDDAGRQVLTVANAPHRAARPVLTGQDVPAERVQALRDAFDAMAQDPALLAELDQANILYDFSSGSDVQVVMEQLLRDTPQSLFDELAELFLN